MPAGLQQLESFGSLWQMFAVPATSLMLETKPLTLPDQSPRSVIDSWGVLRPPPHTHIHNLKAGERERKERGEGKMGTCC